MERKVWASPRSPEAALALAQAAADIISPRDGVSMSPFKRSSAKRESNTSRLKEYADVRQHQALLLEMGRTPEEALKRTFEIPFENIFNDDLENDFKTIR